MSPQKPTYTQMPTATLSTTAPKQNQSKRPPTDRQNMEYLYNGMLFSHKKKSSIDAYHITQINLENIMVSERSQAQRPRIV